MSYSSREQLEKINKALGQFSELLRKIGVLEFTICGSLRKISFRLDPNINTDQMLDDLCMCIENEYRMHIEHQKESAENIVE